MGPDAEGAAGWIALKSIVAKAEGGGGGGGEGGGGAEGLHRRAALRAKKRSIRRRRERSEADHVQHQRRSRLQRFVDRQ